MTDAPDTGKVKAAAGTFSEREQFCGCRGVPDGQHLPDCSKSRTLPAILCTVCGFRTETRHERCGLCGAPKVAR